MSNRSKIGSLQIRDRVCKWIRHISEEKVVARILMLKSLSREIGRTRLDRREMIELLSLPRNPMKFVSHFAEVRKRNKCASVCGNPCRQRREWSGRRGPGSRRGRRSGPREASGVSYGLTPCGDRAGHRWTELPLKAEGLFPRACNHVGAPERSEPSSARTSGGKDG